MAMLTAYIITFIPLFYAILLTYMKSLLAIMDEHGTVRSYEKEEILVHQGEPQQQVYYVQKGLIKVYRIDDTGRELIVDFKSQYDIFSDTWVHKAESSEAMFYYEALEDSEVSVIPRDTLYEEIRNNVQAMRAILQYFIRNETAAKLQISALNQTRAGDKVHSTLAFLAYKFGKKTRDGRYQIPFKITHSTLAGLTGLTRETATIELRKLRKDGVLENESSHFIVEPDILHEIDREHTLDQESGDLALAPRSPLAL
ncbi:Crp/Fnr family transcriptional regulator [Candidatus Saccharibacteria bacterium]|nr:Crp/Fnr family transcriptional regulator [Candidatus Saccharibacteria bacterium]